MNSPDKLHVTVLDPTLAQEAGDQLELGHYFVFVRDGRLSRERGRRGRLQAHRQGARAVLAAFTTPVEVAGLRITPPERGLGPAVCLVADRDVYRAEQDTVRLFVVAPPELGPLTLVVEHNGAALLERPLEAAPEGVAIETLSMLLAGRYQATLRGTSGTLGQPAHFTVAEYSLAPLSAKLHAHTLARGSGTLSYELSATSYEQPYQGALEVELLDGERALGRAVITAEADGRYRGRAALSGEGPFRLRLWAASDPSRLAEVVIPGARAAERSLTCLSELGREQLVSSMPEAGARAVRGLYLSEADHLATPLVVDEVVVDAHGTLRAQTEVEALTLIIVDVATGRHEVRAHGTLAAGAELEIPLPGPVCSVLVGCFVEGEPFEAITGFLRTPRLGVRIAAPARAQPEDEVHLEVHTTGADEPVQCLVVVRDRRLTQTDTPGVALAAATKRALEGLSGPLDHDDVAFPSVDVALRAQAQAERARAEDLMILGPAHDPVRVTHTPFTIGRGAHNDLVLHAAGVEHSHLRIVHDGQHYLVVDLSEGHTLRAGAPVTRLPVMHVEELRVGSAVLVLHVEPKQRLAEDGPVYLSVDDELYGDELDGGEAPRRPTSAPIRGGLLQRLGGVSLGHHGALGAIKSGVWEDSPLLADDAGDEGAAPEAAPPELRATFPEVLLFALHEVRGSAVIVVPLGGALTTYSVEVFAWARGDWASAEATLVVDQPVRVDLDVPPCVHPDDEVLGHLRATAATGQVRVRLHRDGQPVELRRADGRLVSPSAVSPGPLELTFALRPGLYEAHVEDAMTGEVDAAEVEVNEPGRFKSYVRELALLSAGEAQSADEPGTLGLRVLPGLEAPFRQLVSETAGYGHLCCEQTGAKILSATVMYLSASAPRARAEAADIICAGVARERTMWRRGRGFTPYPEVDEVSSYYSPAVVRYLWSLARLEGLRELPRGLERAVREGLELADDVAPALGLARVPRSIRSLEDAYAVARGDESRHAEARAYVEAQLPAETAGERPRPVGLAARALAALGRPSPPPAMDPVTQRRQRAYAAATLLATGERGRGLRLANEVLRALDASGRLYSTYDSAAAIALFGELERCGVARAPGRVEVDGQVLDTARAAAAGGNLERVRVLEGVALIERTHLVVEDWATFRGGPAVTVGFRGPDGDKRSRFRRGDRVELVVRIARYTMGDILHASLPACMTWVRGGARVKRLSLDFAGRTELVVPLVVTGDIRGREHFALCVRNMFEESRATSPGLITVSAA